MAAIGGGQQITRGRGVWTPFGFGAHVQRPGAGQGRANSKDFTDDEIEDQGHDDGQADPEAPFQDWAKRFQQVCDPLKPAG